MVDFVRPNYLGTKKEFKSMFERPIKNAICIDSTRSDIKLARQRTHVLIEMLKGFVMRRSHHILKNILPQSLEYVILVRKSPIQRLLYRAFLQNAQCEIASQGTSVFNPLKAFAACSKIWNHPDILYDVLERENEASTSNGNGSMNAPPEDMKSVVNPSTSAMQFNDLVPSPQPLMMPGPTNGLTMNGSHVRKGNGWNPNRTISKALMEEMGFDKGVSYDWARLAMFDYQTGLEENGFKMAISMDLIRQSVLAGDKVLLFSQSLLTLNLIERFLEKTPLPECDIPWKKNRTYLRFDGSTPASEREKLIDRFNKSSSVCLFLISTRAGSLGINLVSANRVIIFDASWNPCHDAQAVCRVYRYGQRKRTYIYRLIMDNCMERGIFNRQIGKNGLQQRVVDDRQLDVGVTKSELEQLLVYDEALDVATEEHDVSSWKIDDHILWLLATNHPSMFAQEPFLHDSVIMEREEGLSAAEKQEAESLYEREKNMMKGQDMERSVSEHDFSRFRLQPDRHWVLQTPLPAHSQGPRPMRSTPIAMGLERVFNPQTPFTPNRAMLVRAKNELLARGYTQRHTGPPQSNQRLEVTPTRRLPICPPTAPGEEIVISDSD